MRTKSTIVTRSMSILEAGAPLQWLVMCLALPQALINQVHDNGLDLASQGSAKWSISEGAIKNCELTGGTYENTRIKERIKQWRRKVKEFKPRCP